MKLSEMAERIQIILDDNLPNNKNNEYLAKLILWTCIDSGMSPPLRENYDLQDYINNVEPFSWEPESHLRIVK